MTTKPPRNATCPCGSGRKFKHCCLGKATSESAKSAEANVNIRPHAAHAPRLSAELAEMFLMRLPDPAVGQRALDEIAQRADSLVRRYHVHRRWLAKVGVSEDVFPNLVQDLNSLEMSYGCRLMHMYCDAIDSLNAHRLHLAALALRSIIELAGAVCYYQQRVSAAVAGGLTEQVQVDSVIALLNLARMGLDSNGALSDRLNGMHFGRNTETQKTTTGSLCQALFKNPARPLLRKQRSRSERNGHQGEALSGSFTQCSATSATPLGEANCSSLKDPSKKAGSRELRPPPRTW